MKLNAVLDDVYKKGIFGRVVANIHVIEFQKRGLPHAHILIILEGQYKLGQQTITITLYVQRFQVQ